MSRTTLYTSVSNFFARARVVLHGGGLTYYICSTSASFAVLLWKAFCFPIKCSFIYIWQYYVPRILFLFLPFLKIHKMPTFYWKGSEHSIYLDWTRIFKLLINIHMALKIGPALKLCSRPRAWLMRPSWYHKIGFRRGKKVISGEKKKKSKRKKEKKRKKEEEWKWKSRSFLLYQLC